MKRLDSTAADCAGAVLLEVTLFAVAALLVSPLVLWMSPVIRLRLTLARWMFVLPMSLAAAVTIRVGYRLGRLNAGCANRSAYRFRRRHLYGCGYRYFYRYLRKHIALLQ